MKPGKNECRHHNARFYGVQKLGNGPGIVLYNCPDCKSTLSEEHLYALREAAEVEAKLAVA